MHLLNSFASFLTSFSSFVNGALFKGEGSEYTIEDVFPNLEAVPDDREVMICSDNDLKVMAFGQTFSAYNATLEGVADQELAVPFKHLDIGAFFDVDGDVYIKVGKRQVFSTAEQCTYRVSRKLKVLPLSHLLLLGNAIYVKPQVKQVVAEPAAEQDASHTVTVADVKTLGEPMQSIEGQTAELPPASIQINIDNSKGKKSKKSKGKKKGKSKRK